jgi:hypothetical protein
MAQCASPSRVHESAGARMLFWQLLGKSKWVCDACPFIPKWSVEDAQGQAQYTLRPDVCCGCVSPPHTPSLPVAAHS